MLHTLQSPIESLANRHHRNARWTHPTRHSWLSASLDVCIEQYDDEKGHRLRICLAAALDDTWDNCVHVSNRLASSIRHMLHAT